ncbi:hypothetical protein ACQPW3_11425 [Actinosynnema sp. CA-248983]
MGSAIESARRGEPSDFYFFEGSYFVKLLPVESSAGVQLVRMVGVDDSSPPPGNDEGGVIEVEMLAQLQQVEEEYFRMVDVLSDWAVRNGEKEVMSALSKMYVR